MALFDAQRPASGPPPARIVGAAWSTAALHIAFVLTIVLVVGPQRTEPDPSPVSPSLLQLIWRADPGDPGGRPPGGKQDPHPASAAQRPGTDRVTLTARTAPSNTDEPKPERPAQEIDVPALPQAAGLREVIGAVTTAAVVIPSRGLGAGGPAGDKTGSGSGPGDGRGRGIEDGAGHGSGVKPPELLVQVRPNYTSGALQARIRGIVTMEVVVQADGSIGDVRILRSLDSTFGLDQEAIKAVKLWRFRPGTRLGKPIAMLVTVEMTFELR